MRSRSAHRLGVVRLTPLTTSTDWSSPNPFTLAAVWTMMCGSPPSLPLMNLPMSETVPEPTVTSTLDPLTPASAASSVPRSACTRASGPPT